MRSLCNIQCTETWFCKQWWSLVWIPCELNAFQVNSSEGRTEKKSCVFLNWKCVNSVSATIDSINRRTLITQTKKKHWLLLFYSISISSAVSKNYWWFFFLLEEKNHWKTTNFLSKKTHRKTMDNISFRYVLQFLISFLTIDAVFSLFLAHFFFYFIGDNYHTFSVNNWECHALLEKPISNYNVWKGKRIEHLICFKSLVEQFSWHFKGKQKSAFQAKVNHQTRWTRREKKKVCVWWICFSKHQHQLVNELRFFFFHEPY